MRWFRSEFCVKREKSTCHDEDHPPRPFSLPGAFPPSRPCPDGEDEDERRGGPDEVGGGHIVEEVRDGVYRHAVVQPEGDNS